MAFLPVTEMNSHPFLRHLQKESLPPFSPVQHLDAVLRKSKKGQNYVTSIVASVFKLPSTRAVEKSNFY